MKKVIIGVFVLTSVTAFAECSVVVGDLGYRIQIGGEDVLYGSSAAEVIESELKHSSEVHTLEEEYSNAYLYGPSGSKVTYYFWKIKAANKALLAIARAGECKLPPRE